MTTNNARTFPPAPQPSPALRRAALVPWAESELGVRLSEGAAEIQSQWIGRLEDETWFPPQAAQYAFETLAQADDPERPIGPAAGGGAPFFSAESAFVAEIDRLGEVFFSLDPAAREKRWGELRGRVAGFPALGYRLDQWQAGLSIPFPNQDVEPSMRDLVRHVGELFCLPPSRRPQRRRTPSQPTRGTVSQWRAAAMRLKRRFPAIAELEPTLIEDLIEGRFTPREGSLERRADAAARSEWAAPSAKTKPGRRRPVSVSNNRGTGSQARNVWIMLAAIGIFIARVFPGPSTRDPAPARTIRFPSELLNRPVVVPSQRRIDTLHELWPPPPDVGPRTDGTSPDSAGGRPRPIGMPTSIRDLFPQRPSSGPPAGRASGTAVRASGSAPS